jgi:hypothetical protein
MRMALTYADAAGAEPDAVKRSELLDLCMTCWRQAQLLRRWPVLRLDEQLGSKPLIQSASRIEGLLRFLGRLFRIGPVGAELGERGTQRSCASGDNSRRGGSLLNSFDLCFCF